MQHLPIHLVVSLVTDKPRQMCGDPVGDEFLTLLNRILGTIKPKIDSAGITINQRVTAQNGDVIFVRIEPSVSTLRPHVVAQKVYIRVEKRRFN